MRWFCIAVLGVSVAAGARAETPGDTAPAREPNTLYVGDRVISLVGKTRITRGQHITDFDLSSRRQMIAFTEPARSATRVSVMSLDTMRPTKTDLPGEPGKLAWSPDGTNLAVFTRAAQPEWRAALWLLEASGGEPRRILAADTMDEVAWSPDGEMIAVACEAPTALAGRTSGDNTVILKLRDGSRQDVGQHGRELRFSPDGKVLWFKVSRQDAQGNRVAGRVEYNLATGETKRQSMRFADGFFSPDEAKVATVTSPPYGDLVVRDLREGPPARLTWNGASKFAAWSPDGQMIAYTRDYPFSDDAHRPVASVPSLWVVVAAGPDSGRQMLVNPVVDSNAPVWWTPDGERLAFVADEDLWMAAFDSRPMKVRERVALGLPVTEEAVREEVTTNARQIALALLMYANDYDEALPPSGADIPQILEPYLKSTDAFYHPLDPGQFIFRYLLEDKRSLEEIDEAASTPLAILDLDADWEVVCFADGHSVAQRKQK